MYEIVTHTTFQDHVEAEKLERAYLPSDVIASAATTWAWGQENPESLFLLREKNKAEHLGHLSAFPVRRDVAQKMIAGELYDTQLPASAVLPYGTTVPADLYFAVVCVDKRHRFRGSRLLLMTFRQFLKNKMDKGDCASIEGFFAEAGTIAGEKLLMHRGFQKVDPAQSVPCYYQAKLSEVI